MWKPSSFNYTDESKITGTDTNTRQQQQFTLISKLEGRGQPGLAAFYSPTNDNTTQLLIKQDDPATCVMEGSADFVKKSAVIPSQLADTVNYAYAGKYTDQKGEINAVSIQARVLPDDVTYKVVPWDIIVYKQKRNPKTLMSSEYWNFEDLKKHLIDMHPITQWQLAGGIFSSSVAGDESLHVGQFMAIQNAQQDIVAIKRIDLGARERYAVARNEGQQYNPYNTSAQYVQSGQWYKDYIDFLLSAEDIKRKYTLLWALANVSNKIEEQYVLSMVNAISSIPEDKKQLAYEGILKTINNGASQIFVPQNNHLDTNILELAAHLGEIAKNRAALMQKVAKENLIKIFDNNQELMEKFIHAYENNNFEKIKDIIDDLENNPATKFEDIDRILYVCDAAILMSMDNSYENKEEQQAFYLNKLKEYQSKLAIFKFMKNFGLSPEDITNEVINDLTNIIIINYDKCNSKQLSDKILCEELFYYGLKQKNINIIKHVLNITNKLQLNLTEFGTQNSARNHRNESRPEGALLLAAKANDYEALLALLQVRENQPLSQVSTLSQFNKTIGSISRKDNEDKNVFHYLFENWDKIESKVDKKTLLTKLLHLLVLENQSLSGGTANIASIFSQPNKNGKTPLHIILDKKNPDAFNILMDSIKNIPALTNFIPWHLGHFINFSAEVTFNKNFLDYTYSSKNEDVFNKLIDVIKKSRSDNILTSEIRNQLLCSSNSPLTEQEKISVQQKHSTQTSGLLNVVSFVLGGQQSGKQSFQHGVELWRNKIKGQRLSNPCK